MSKQISGVSAARIATCPHGMPPGACPICNGGGGGGGARKLGTMSWSECFAAGARMRHAKEAVEMRTHDAHKFALEASFNTSMAARIASFKESIANFQKNLPAPVASVVNVLNRVLITPLLNLADKISKIVENVKNTIDTVHSALVNIAEKLSSVFGELKNFIGKAVSDNFNNFRKKLKKLFSIFGNNEEEEIEAKNFLEVFSTKKEE